MVLFHDTFLMVNNGNLWIDNLYLRVSKQLARPTMAFINLGRADSDPFLTSVNPGDTYITRTTFQPDGRGTTIGITADTSDCTLLVDGALIVCELCYSADSHVPCAHTLGSSFCLPRNCASTHRHWGTLSRTRIDSNRGYS